VIAAVVLAAGGASRFGSPKQQLMLPDVLRAVRASSVDEVVVVEGAHSLQVTTCNLEEGPAARVVRCDEWERGMGASLRCGLESLPTEAEAAIVVLADGPDLAPQAIDRVIAAWRSGGSAVVAASYGGVRGHPVLLARSAWPDVPDEGARALDPALISCDDLGPPGDVDYPEDVKLPEA
jgi:nicotine blue oxidoreductase